MIKIVNGNLTAQKLRTQTRKQAAQLRGKIQTQAQLQRAVQRLAKTPTTPQQKTTFQISKGGATVQLTPSQVIELEALVQSSFEKGGSSTPFFGRSEAIRKAGSFIIAQSKARGFEAARSSAFGRRQVLEQKALKAGAIGQTQSGRFITPKIVPTPQIQRQLTKNISDPTKKRSFLREFKEVAKISNLQASAQSKLRQGKSLTKAETDALGQRGFDVRGRFNDLFDKFFDDPVSKAAGKTFLKDVVVNIPGTKVKGVGLTEQAIAFDPSGLALSVLLSPLIDRGAAAKGKRVKVTAKTKQTSKVTSGVRFTSDELDDVATALRNEVLKGNTANARRIAERALRSGDKKQIKFARELLEDSLGKKRASDIFRDVRQQEVPGIVKPAPRVRAGTIDKTGKLPGAGPITGASQPPLLEPGVPASTEAPAGPEREFQPATTASFERNQQRVRDAQIRNELRTELARLPLGERVQALQTDRFKTLTRSATSTLSGTKTLQDSRQQELQRQDQQTRQLLNQQQLTRQSQKFKQLPRTAQALILKQQLKARQGLAQRQTFRLRKIVKKPRFGTPFPFPKLKEKKLKTSKTLKKKSRVLFDTLVRREGKFTKRGKSTTKNRALKRGVSITSKNLSASFKVVPTGRIAKKNDIRFRVPKKTYRRSKVDPKVWVERKELRLDSGKEVRTIQKEKKLKSKSMIKRRKK